MAKIVASFDSYEPVDSYEGRQVIAQARQIDGVSAVKVYRAVSGQPRYAVEVEADEAKLDDVQKGLENWVAPYRSYLSSYSVRVLKEMSL